MIVLDFFPRYCAITACRKCGQDAPPTMYKYCLNVDSFVWKKNFRKKKTGLRQSTDNDSDISNTYCPRLLVPSVTLFSLLFGNNKTNAIYGEAISPNRHIRNNREGVPYLATVTKAE